MNPPGGMFGAKLRMARAYANLNMRELGDAVGVSHNAIAKYESGDMHPKSSVLVGMARHLNVSLDWLMCTCAPQMVCACRNSQNAA